MFIELTQFNLFENNEINIENMPQNVEKIIIPMRLCAAINLLQLYACMYVCTFVYVKYINI